MLSINNIIGSVQKTFDTPDYIIFKVYKVDKVPLRGVLFAAARVAESKIITFSTRYCTRRIWQS